MIPELMKIVEHNLKSSYGAIYYSKMETNHDLIVGVEQVISKFITLFINLTTDNNEFHTVGQHQYLTVNQRDVHLMNAFENQTDPDNMFKLKPNVNKFKLLCTFLENKSFITGHAILDLELMDFKNVITNALLEGAKHRVTIISNTNKKLIKQILSMYFINELYYLKLRFIRYLSSKDTAIIEMSQNVYWTIKNHKFDFYESESYTKYIVPVNKQLKPFKKLLCYPGVFIKVLGINRDNDSNAMVIHLEETSDLPYRYITFTFGGSSGNVGTVCAIKEQYISTPDEHISKTIKVTELPKYIDEIITKQLVDKRFDIECGICNQEKKTFVLKCRHILCSNCIKKMFKDHHLHDHSDSGSDSDEDEDDNNEETKGNSNEDNSEDHSDDNEHHGHDSYSDPYIKCPFCRGKIKSHEFYNKTLAKKLKIKPIKN